MSLNIYQISETQLPTLQKIATATFLAAYAHQNDAKFMDSYIGEYFSETHLINELRNKDSKFYFVELAGELIGYLKLNVGSAQTEHKLEDALEIERIYVIAAQQGKGWGSALIDFSMDVARAAACTQVWLGVWNENLAAIRFYEKNGFEVFGAHSFNLGGLSQIDLMMKKRV